MQLQKYPPDKMRSDSDHLCLLQQRYSRMCSQRLISVNKVLILLQINRKYIRYNQANSYNKLDFSTTPILPQAIFAEYQRVQAHFRTIQSAVHLYPNQLTNIHSEYADRLPCHAYLVKNLPLIIPPTANRFHAFM